MPIIDDRRAGYLASLDNVPPLIFRFQFNPESISDKKQYNYEPANGYGQWGFDQASAASGLVATLAGFSKDVKEIGALLVRTKPLQPKEGQDRQISLDLVLDARVPGPRDGDDHFGGSIEPDLAVLRSFMSPSWDLIDVTKLIASGFKNASCWNTPPQCSLKYGGLSVTCVMTDLSIKITAFQPDGSPARAEVSVSLKEQTFSLSPLVDFIVRTGYDVRALVRPGIGTDFIQASPVQSVLDAWHKVF